MDQGIMEVANYADKTEMEFHLLHPPERNSSRPLCINYAETGKTLLQDVSQDSIW